MMKYINSLFLAFALLLASSCSYIDGFGEDPNNAGDGPTPAVMSAAMVGYDVSLTVQDAWYSAIWTQQISGAALQWIGIDNYDVTSSTFDWEPEYYGCLGQCAIAIEKLQAEGNQVGEGAMTVLQAHIFGHVTALWGDVPFSDALKFTEGSKNPEYDDQLSVYTNVQTLLDQAIANLESGVGSTLGVDLFHGGDASKWIEVAHTLKARFYLHVKDYNNAIIHAQQGISSPLNNHTFPHPGGIQKQDINLWNSFLTIDRPGDIGATGSYLAKLLDADQGLYRGNAKTDESARFAFYYTPASAPGEEDYNINTGANGVFTSTSSDQLITFSENQLILAEALLRQSTPDVNGALDALNSVRQALNIQFGDDLYLDYESADFETAGIAGIAGNSAVEALLFEVVEEKYACLFGNIEAYNDLKRTKNLLGLTPTAGNQIPERFLLPEEETNANSNAPNPIPGLYEITAANEIPL